MSRIKLLPLLQCARALLIISAIFSSTHLQAATLGYWRMENSSDLGLDSSGNNLNMTNSGPVGSYNLPATGVGSAFFDPIPQTGAANIRAGQFNLGESDHLSIADPFSSAYVDLTIESMINLTTAGATTEVRPIASQWSASSTNHSWQLGITGNTSGLGARNLILQVATSGTGGTVVNLDSDFQLSLSNDYYIAASLDFTGSNLAVTFYVQNLTGGGSLQSNVVQTTLSGLYNSTAPLYIGRGGSTTGSNLFFNGTIDEVRISDTALTQSQLLAVPEPSATLLVLLGGLHIILRRCRRFR